MNLLIGVVINSLDEARQMESTPAGRPPAAPAGPGREVLPGGEVLRDRVETARRALDELQSALDAADGTCVCGAVEGRRERQVTGVSSG
ncbi:hypothetical protein ACFT8W_14860 [Streptomyces hygroscopicus]|uniref:hypothetical protein n=1 Tax=Streptomyces hygroscopicus TaxID=1912 RepID=UPI003640989F